MNAIAKTETAEVFDAVPTLQAENLVSGIWDSIEEKIVPDCLLQCFTEDGISQTAARILETEIFYRPETDEFFIRVHTQYYRSDTGNVVFYSIRQIGRKLDNLKFQFTGAGAEALARSLRKTSTHSGLKSIQCLMKTEPGLIRMTGEIDPAGLLMTPSGARDPFTGDTVKRPGAVFTKCTNYDPALGAVPTEFYKFLSEIFKITDPEKTEAENDEATASVIDRLLDVLAAAITGQAPQVEKFLVFSGRGGSGKQQLLECLEKVFGDYFEWMRPESIYESGAAAGDTPRSDLLRIAGALIVGISEPSDAKLSSSLFKTLGSGEPIPCRPHHSRTVIEVRPRALFVIAANRKPYLAHDSGTRRRIEFYEFNNEFHKSENRVLDIGRKIAELEGPAILGELMRRAGSWRARGGDLAQIAESETVQRWTDNHTEWGDVIGRFLHDETVSIPGETCGVSEMQRRYTEWADRMGETRMSGRALGEALSERGIAKIRRKDGWKFTGIILKGT